MSEYHSPLVEMRFLLRELADFERIAALPGQQELSLELAEAVLEEAGKFASGVLAPLNASADRSGGARWQAGEVTTATGWREAYQQFVDAGWPALSSPIHSGGQGLPRVVSALVDEMWNSANVSFALCPMLTRGALEALELCGSAALKSVYRAKMVSGEWAGTMNLTESQAGSDLAAVRTRAEPGADGAWRIHGQKIFITYGDHDLTENIVHLVLARTPNAPEGVKGISMFLVPKFIPRTDGSRGESNDVACVSIEHKLGIHGSPTAVLAYGAAGGGATGWLVGEECRGLEYMFVMMNAARFAVGLEGVGLAERAWQQAHAYATQRIQGTEVGAASRERVTITRHPDVRRMLLHMRVRTEALRATAVAIAAATDLAAAHPDADERRRHRAFVELMIPVFKGWSTESAVEIASMGIQVHGGMGYVEETGAAQHWRDARITPIYEGTTGIQAADLIGRKIARDDGAAALALLAEMRATHALLRGCNDAALQAMDSALDAALTALESALEHVRQACRSDLRVALAASVPLLQMLGLVSGGWQMARAGLAAARLLNQGPDNAGFLRAKLRSMEFYATHVLPGTAALLPAIRHGHGAVLAADAGL